MSYIACLDIITSGQAGGPDFIALVVSIASTEPARGGARARIATHLGTRVCLDFHDTKWYTNRVSRRDAPGKERDPGNRREDSHWSSERSNYATNEETNTPLRDGISNRLGAPVQAGKPSLWAD